MNILNSLAVVIRLVLAFAATTITNPAIAQSEPKAISTVPFVTDEQNHLLIPATIGDTKVSFLLDTGSGPKITIFKWAVAELKIPVTGNVPYMLNGKFMSCVALKFFNCPALGVSADRSIDVVVEYPDEDYARKNCIVGIIGTGVLRDFQ